MLFQRRDHLYQCSLTSFTHDPSISLRVRRAGCRACVRPKVTIGNPPSGGTSAVVASVAPDGLAAKSARPGADVEVGDQIVSINGRRLCNCTNDEAIALFKASTVSMVLRSVVPGTEVIYTTCSFSSPPLSLFSPLWSHLLTCLHVTLTCTRTHTHTHTHIVTCTHKLTHSLIHPRTHARTQVDDDVDSEEKADGTSLYSTSAPSLFHKVLPSDFVTLA